MRTLSLSTLFLLATCCQAAPALGEKPPKWEYAELSYRTNPGRPAGVDADGNQIAAVPASVSIKWASGSGELDAKSWEEMADKLKATGFKKDASVTLQKIQFLNHLGSEGWELMEQSSTSPLQSAAAGPGGRATTLRSIASTTWMMKRRVP